ncbi:hypothetical protein LCGC14_2753130 [marine sediment metagenome]|uniref:Uncharacterized protein n=1 Tax=marine sediment metagenome TaxID=412755 RepID=A0A0F9B9T5_9ZZZZ
MADIFYVQASHDWEVESADVTVDQTNINDRDFNTTYTVTGASSSDKVIWLDRGEVPMSGSYAPVESIAVMMHSGSKVNWGASAAFNFYQNFEVGTASKVGGTGGTLTSNLDENAGIFFIDIPTTYNLRYIQIVTVSMPVDPIITQVMLLRKRTISRTSAIHKSHQWPTWNTTTAALSGLHTLRYSNFRRPIQAFRQHYPLYSAANIANAQGIGKGVRGRLQPFIYQPKTTIADMYICHMSKDKERFIPIEHEHKEIVFKFEEIYRIQSGYTT